MEVKGGQTFYDMVIEGTGSMDNAFAMSLLNGKSQTEELQTLEEIKPAGKVLRAVTDLFIEFQPATAITKNDNVSATPLNGIGSMAVGQDFIAS